MWEYHDPYHPAADELYHFKYIKRVQGPNGKWQYYYDRDALKSTYRNARNNAIRKSVDARNSINNLGTSLGWTANKVKRKFNTAKFVAQRNLAPYVKGAKTAIGSAASYAKGAYRNARNNAIRKGIDAKRTLGNKASALSYRLKNRGLAGRQADQNATDSMVESNRRSLLIGQNKRKATVYARRNKGLAERQAEQDFINRYSTGTGHREGKARARRINADARGELARQKVARRRKRMTPAERKASDMKTFLAKDRQRRNRAFRKPGAR